MNQELSIKNKVSGFTMIEALIYISLVAAISVVFTSFTADVIRSSGKAFSIKEVDQSARLLLSRISQEIKTSKNIDSLTTNELALTDEVDRNIVFTFDSANEIVNFDIVNPADGLPPAQISNNSVRITNLVFEQLSTGAVSVRAVVDQKNPNLPKNQQYHLDLTTVVTPRGALY